MFPNFLVLGACALVPFFFAFIWYNPKLFGGENWKSIAGLTDEQHNKKAGPLFMVLSILFNFFIAVGLYWCVVHAGHVLSLMGGDSKLLFTEPAASFLAEYGMNHLSFGYGAFHGLLAAIYFAIPIVGYAYMFERKRGKYFWVNVGYWAINCAIMGGIIGQWGWVVPVAS